MSRMSYHGKILLRSNGGRRDRDRKPNSVEGLRGEAETESQILGLIVLELLADGWCWCREAQCLIQALLEAHILYTWLWERHPWDWVRLSDWVKETQCVVKVE